MQHLTTRIGGVLGVILLALTPLVHSEPLPAPKGTIVLTISGEIKHPNVGDEVQMDMAMLKALPMIQFETRTPWHDDVQSFSGVRLNALLTAIGSEATKLVAVGLDDYRFTISDMDLDKYPVIIAYQHNGRPITVRNLGPLRIMMPFDDFPELQTPLNESRSVWQLVKLELP